MPKLMMVFASLSGNTEQIASAIAEGIREEGLEVEYKEVTDVSAQELQNYDGILLGSYTWGDGELADEFLDFYDEMDSLDLSGKKAAVFGSGDHAYEHFCGAVDLLQDKLTEKGAEVVQEGLRIEMSPSKDEEELCKEFGRSFVKHLLLVGK